LTQQEPTVAEHAKKRITLQEAADLLGIHYMTAYRHVRLGTLPAERADGRWWVAPSDLDLLRRQRAGPTRGKRGQPDWRTHQERLDRMLLAGDGPGAWGVVESALRGGAEPAAVYVDLLAPVLRDIGQRWSKAQVTVADEHRATAAARRLVGRLGPRFTRVGRPRAVVLLGGAAGDHHELPLAMLSDVLRGAGYHVADLGPNTPVASFVEAAGQTPSAAIGISAATDAAVKEARATVKALRAAGRHEPILVGGPAVNDAVAARTGADEWAGDARVALERLDALVAPLPTKRGRTSRGEATSSQPEPTGVEGPTASPMGPGQRDG